MSALYDSAREYAVKTVDAARRDLLLAEARRMQELSLEWLSTVQDLEARLANLAFDMAQQFHATGRISHALLYQQEQYLDLLAHARMLYLKYARLVEQLVAAAQERSVLLAVQQGVDAINMLLQATQGRPSVATAFNVLGVDAVHALLENLREDAPLGKLLDGLFPPAADKLAAALVDGLRQGKNPRAIADAMRSALNNAFERSLVIARTEVLRAYRTALRKQYAESGVVVGYKRIAAKGPRTCIACLVADGAFYPVEEDMPEHPQGRCSMVPVLKYANAPVPVWETGREWFLKQDEGTQAQILGRRRFQLWKDRRFSLDDIYRVVSSLEWGGSLQVTPLNQLV